MVSAMPSPKETTAEREAAGKVLTELLSGYGATAAFVRALADLGRKQPQGTCMQWKKGMGFGNEQREIAARILGVPRATFGFEPEDEVAIPKTIYAIQTRHPSLHVWLEQHPDADQDLVDWLRTIDGKLPADLGVQHYEWQAKVFEGAKAQRDIAKALVKLPASAPKKTPPRRSKH